MKKALKIILVAVVALLLSVAMTLARGSVVTIGKFEYLPIEILVGPCVFFIYTLICLRNIRAIKPQLTPLIIASGGCGILLPVIIFSYKEMHPMIVCELFMQTISILAAYFVFTSRRLFSKISIVILTAVAAIWMTFYGSYLYLDYYSYGSWTGRISQQIKQPVAFQNFQGETVALEAYKGSYLLLDCWNSWCGVCYQKFPDLQAIYDKYKDNPAVTIGALHCRFENKDENYRTGYDIIQEYGYTFPVFSINRDLPVLKELEVRYFPTVLIFSPSGELVFRGELDGADKFLKKVV